MSAAVITLPRAKFVDEDRSDIAEFDAEFDSDLFYIRKTDGLIPEQSPIRDALANILRDAVEESLLPGGEDARAWLSGEAARNAFLQLDVCPDAVMASLRKKWNTICRQRVMDLFDTVH